MIIVRPAVVSTVYSVYIQTVGNKLTELRVQSLSFDTGSNINTGMKNGLLNIII